MRFDEYRKHDAVSLAQLIAKREVSAKEVLETAITRAEQVNPAINAIVHKQYEQAHKAIAAALPDGPLRAFERARLIWPRSLRGRGLRIDLGPAIQPADRKKIKR